MMRVFDFESQQKLGRTQPETFGKVFNFLLSLQGAGTQTTADQLEADPQ